MDSLAAQKMFDLLPGEEQEALVQYRHLLAVTMLIDERNDRIPVDLVRHHARSRRHAGRRRHPVFSVYAAHWLVAHGDRWAEQPKTIAALRDVFPRPSHPALAPNETYVPKGRRWPTT